MKQESKVKEGIIPAEHPDDDIKYKSENGAMLLCQDDECVYISAKQFPELLTIQNVNIHKMEKQTVISLNHPTPKLVKYLVRAISWITATYALLISLGLDLADFGVSEHTQFLVLKYMSIATGGSSVISRFIGVKPVKFDTDNPEPPKYGT